MRPTCETCNPPLHRPSLCCRIRVSAAGITSFLPCRLLRAGAAVGVDDLQDLTGCRMGRSRRPGRGAALRQRDRMPCVTSGRAVSAGRSLESSWTPGSQSRLPRQGAPATEPTLRDSGEQRLQRFYAVTGRASMAFRGLPSRRWYDLSGLRCALLGELQGSAVLCVDRRRVGRCCLKPAPRNDTIACSLSELRES